MTLSILKYIKIEIVTLNANNISHYYCSTVFFNYINAAGLVSIRDLFKKKIQQLSDHRLLNGSVYVHSEF